MQIFTRVIGREARRLILQKHPNARTNFHLEKAFVRHIHESGEPENFGGRKALERLRLRDGVPKSYTLIYRSNFPNYLLFSQIFVFLAAGAVVAGFAIYLTQEELSEEEKERNKLKQKAIIEEKKQKELTNPNSFMKIVQDFKDSEGLVDAPAKPGLDDILDNEGLQVAILTSSFIILAAAMFRMQRLMPVRIYSNNKNKHCIAVKYGHILPGKLTWHEFLAGTIRPVEGKNATLYRDGSGGRLIIMDQFFRSAADYNWVMGFDQQESEKENDKIMRSL